MLQSHRVIFGLVAMSLSAGCRTSSTSGSVKDQQSFGSENAALKPPAGTKTGGSAWLPPCDGGAVACPASFSEVDKGCAATDGANVFNAIEDGSNCAAGLKIRKQICDQGLDPAGFQSACFIKSGGDALSPPPGTQNAGKAWLPPCNGGAVACPGSFNAAEKGCAATDGVNVFKAIEDGSNCSAGLQIRKQICDQGLDPTAFQSACFTKAGDDALSPPPGTQKAGNAWLPPCNDGAVACPGSFSAAEKGCAATDGANVFKAIEDGNNCSAGLQIRKQICDQGLDPTAFQSACFVKAGGDALSPPPGTKKIGKAWLPPCDGGAVACPASFSAVDKGCAATDGANVFKAVEDGNNCSAGLKIREKICAQGLDPASFQSACFGKN